LCNYYKEYIENILKKYDKFVFDFVKKNESSDLYRLYNLIDLIRNDGYTDKFIDNNSEWDNDEKLSLRKRKNVNLNETIYSRIMNVEKTLENIIENLKNDNVKKLIKLSNYSDVYIKSISAVLLSHPLQFLVFDSILYITGKHTYSGCNLLSGQVNCAGRMYNKTVNIDIPIISCNAILYEKESEILTALEECGLIVKKKAWDMNKEFCITILLNNSE